MRQGMSDQTMALHPFSKSDVNSKMFYGFVGLAGILETWGIFGDLWVSRQIIQLVGQRRHI